MFDQQAYASIFQAMYDILGRNRAMYGTVFCNGVMTDYDPRNGQEAQNNSMNLLNHVLSEARRLTNSTTLSQEQLFIIVGDFIKQMFELWKSRQSQNQFGGGGGFSRGGFSGQTTTFGGGGGGFSSGGGGFGQQARVGPASYLDDSADRRPAPQANPGPVPVSPSVVFAPMTSPEPTVKMSENPLDAIPETGVDFTLVEKKPLWGDTITTQPKDRRIIVGAREDLTTRDDRFRIPVMTGYHQQIMDKPIDVARDFFAVVPDSLMALPFMFRVSYNHLEIVNVPTVDFVQVRQNVISGLTNNSRALVHEKIGEILDSMQRGPYKNMAAYLVAHVNRALYLSARLVDNPIGVLKISEFDDIKELLSSSYNSAFTRVSEGRELLERIVSSALYNALVKNTDVMFTGSAIPTNAIQSSPAFPFSMEGVYPNKFSIPTKQEANAETFLRNMNEFELSRKTYTLSRRSVVITNILGKHVLPKLSSEPTTMTNTAAAFLNNFSQPYTANPIRADVFNDVVPYALEDYPSDQLESYYSDTERYVINEVERFGNIRPNGFPVDQTIFAFQYGVSPEEYLTAIDVFDTLDGQASGNKVILAKRNIKDINITT